MTDPHPESAVLAELSATQLAFDIANAERSSAETTASLLSRIEAIERPGASSALHAIAAVHSEALDVATTRDTERDQGRRRGPLHGVPVVIKDNIEAIGLPAMAGSSALVGRPTRDAPLVTRLVDAGAVLLASTNLSQWANLRSPRSTSGWSATGGLVANPWALDRSAGGSSSGTGAAVAGGLAPFGVGTETDGSIICPSSLNGLVGLKPTVGHVPTQFVVPLSHSQDAPGPMARSVADVALLYRVLSGRDRPHVGPVTWAAASWRTGHPATDARFAELLEWLAAAGSPAEHRSVVEPGAQEYEDELAVLLSEMRDDLSAYLAARPGGGVRSLDDVVAYERGLPEVELPYFGNEFFEQALATGGCDTERYRTARTRNLTWARDTCLGPALDGIDVLLAPAYGPAWKSDLTTGGHPGAASVATMPAAVAGWPILTVPMGLVHGLPVGVALLARAHEEEKLLAAAARVESVVREHVDVARPTWAPPARG